MRNSWNHKIPYVSDNDKHIADRFMWQRLHKAHILMKLHMQIGAVLGYLSFIGQQ